LGFRFFLIGYSDQNPIGVFKVGRAKEKGRKQVSEFEQDITEYRPSLQTRPLRAQNESQGQYISLISSSIVTFGLGPAGTGKTYVAAALACEQLASKKISQIIISRPAMEADENLGALPGELEEKFDPYFAPVRDVLYERLGKNHTEGMIKSGRIQIQPLAYMRGKSFKDAWVILDEAQNTSPKQMLMFLTRIGDNCKAIVNGDLNQQDRPGASGLADAVKRLKGVAGVSMHQFTREDIVRSGIVRAILERYD
jgi:phosphate starvation-inducible PhoH-like protein